MPVVVGDWQSFQRDPGANSQDYMIAVGSGAGRVLHIFLGIGYDRDGLQSGNLDPSGLNVPITVLDRNATVGDGQSFALATVAIPDALSGNVTLRLRSTNNFYDSWLQVAVMTGVEPIPVGYGVGRDPDGNYPLQFSISLGTMPVGSVVLAHARSFSTGGFSGFGGTETIAPTYVGSHPNQGADHQWRGVLNGTTLAGSPWVVDPTNDNTLIAAAVAYRPAAAGPPPIAGSAAINDGAVTGASTGHVRILGAAIASDAADVVSALGSTLVRGQHQVIDATEAALGAARLRIAAAYASQDEEDVASGEGRGANIGRAEIPDDDDRADGTARTGISGGTAQSIVESGVAAGTLHLRATGAEIGVSEAVLGLGHVGIVGRAAVAEPDELSVATASLVLSGTAFIVDADDSVISTSAGARRGAADLFDADDLLTAFGVLRILAAHATVDQSEIGEGAVAAHLRGNAALVDADDRTTGAAVAVNSARAVLVEDDDAGDGVASAYVRGMAASTEDGESLVAVARTTVSAQAWILDTADGIVADGRVRVSARGVAPDLVGQQSATRLRLRAEAYLVDAADTVLSVSTRHLRANAFLFDDDERLSATASLRLDRKAVSILAVIAGPASVVATVQGPEHLRAVAVSSSSIEVEI